MTFFPINHALVRMVELTKIQGGSMLIVPESIVKLYSLKEGQKFHLEVKESKNVNNLLILTYAAIIT